MSGVVCGFWGFLMRLCLGWLLSELMCCLGVGCVFFFFCLSLLGFVSGCVCPLLGVVESHPRFAWNSDTLSTPLFWRAKS